MIWTWGTHLLGKITWFFLNMVPFVWSIHSASKTAVDYATNANQLFLARFLKVWMKHRSQHSSTAAYDKVCVFLLDFWHFWHFLQSVFGYKTDLDLAKDLLSSPNQIEVSFFEKKKRKKKIRNFKFPFFFFRLFPTTSNMNSHTHPTQMSKSITTLLRKPLNWWFFFLENDFTFFPRKRRP